MIEGWAEVRRPRRRVRQRFQSDPRETGNR